MYTQGLMGWGYMQLCCHLVGSWSLIVNELTDINLHPCFKAYPGQKMGLNFTVIPTAPKLMHRGRD